MQRFHIKMIWAALPLAALWLAGCGGSTTAPTSSAPAHTVAQPAQTVTQSAQTVTQIVKTVTEAAPAPPKRKPKTVTEAAPAPPKRKPTSASSGPKVPSGLVGEVLVQAEQTLSDHGISFTTAGGNVFLRSDWGVCSTTPSGGQSVNGAVVLNIGHFTCGAG
jgi:hypothetical protein